MDITKIRKTIFEREKMSKSDYKPSNVVSNILVFSMSTSTNLAFLPSLDTSAAPFSLEKHENPWHKTQHIHLKKNIKFQMHSVHAHDQKFTGLFTPQKILT